MVTTGWYTRLWRSEDKVVFVAKFEGAVLSALDVSPSTDHVWTTWDVEGSLMGIWGLSARDVFAWGRRHDEPVLYWFDGQR